MDRSEPTPPEILPRPKATRGIRGGRAAQRKRRAWQLVQFNLALGTEN